MEMKIYSYTDLTPLLEQAQQKASNLSQKAFSLNAGRVATPKEPKEWRKTLPQMAEERGHPRAVRQTKNIIGEIEGGLDEHQKLMQQYKDETDRRNNILNRMDYLKGIMRDWYNSDAKDKLAGFNMVWDSVKEYSKLKQEADKFLKYIKK